MASHSQTLPTILLIPGAFHSPSCFSSLLPHLQASGYPTVAVTLPSLNPPATDTTDHTIATDASYLLTNYIIPLVEHSHKELIIFAHSYGGGPSAAAATGYDVVTRRKNGSTGGVLGLVFIAVNMINEGESLLDSVGGAYPPFIKLDTPSPGLAVIDPLIPTLYHDVEPALAARLAEKALPHAMTAFTSPAPKPAWREPELEGRRVYVRCTEDRCLPKELQDKWIEECGISWDVRDVEASHSAFVSQEKKVAEIVVEFARKWAGE